MPREWIAFFAALLVVACWSSPAVARRFPARCDEVDACLVALQAAAAPPASEDRDFVRRLILQQIAHLDGAGERAGPTVRALLGDSDATVRVAAARTLGRIGDRPAIAALISALDDERDPRLVWAASEALGRLQAVEAVPALDRVAGSHWYPTVRAQAAAASAAIRAGEAWTEPAGFHMFDQMPTDVASCSDGPTANPTAASTVPGPRYTSEVVGYGPDGEHRRTIEVEPDVAVPVEGGWLASSDRGEWGGELMFVPHEGAPSRLYGDNVAAIHRLGDQWVAIGGLAHLSMNHGVVLGITRGADGRWSAREWRQLPAAPRSTWKEGEALAIDTSGGGTLLLSPDGSFRMAPCGDAPPASAEAGDP